MEEQAVIQQFERWHRSGNAEALRDGLTWLERWLPLPAAIVQALGREVAEETREKVIERLLLGDAPLLLSARHPRALARRSLHNALIDALRWKGRQPEALSPGQAQEIAERIHSGPAPDVEQLLDEERLLLQVVCAMDALRFEERAALLLLHAPDRLTQDDWRTVVARHPPPGPLRPEDVLPREDIAALLFPDLPEHTAYERVAKQLQRAYVRLRKALAVPEDGSGEEAP